MLSRHDMAKPVAVSAICRIEWNIENIFSVPKQESGQFAFKGSLWKLVLDKLQTSDGTALFRILLEDKGSKPFDDFASRAFIVDKNRTPQFLWENLCRYNKAYYCTGPIWCMSEEHLRQKEDILSMDGEISFVCILMPRTAKEGEDIGNKPVQTSISVKAGDSVETLILDLRRMLDNSALSDVTLTCGDLTIPAHRLILSARSKVFAAMLRNDMTESSSGVIEITDMDPPILEQFLQFIYSCKLPDMTMDAAPQLYEAADKYCVESLKKDCSAFMMENLTEGNACSILHLADAHSDSDLKGGVMSFIVEKKLFLKDDIWLKFCEDHPKLAIEVLNRACKILVSCFV